MEHWWKYDKFSIEKEYLIEDEDDTDNFNPNKAELFWG